MPAARPSLLLLVLLAAWGFTPSAAAVAPRTLALNSLAEVGGDGVFLDQILSVRPTAALPHLQVAPAPAAGETAALSRAEVTRWMEVHTPDFLSTNWLGVDTVHIKRRSRSLEETELKDLLTTTLQEQCARDRGELELRLTRAWNPVLVPDEPLTLKILDLPATAPNAYFVVRFELDCGEERLGTWQMSVSAKLWRDVPVALAPIKRGQILADAPVALERRDVLALRDTPGAFEISDASLEFVQNLSAGQPVLARSVRARPVVQRGQLVAALVQEGPLSIVLKVEALEDGLPGELVRIRNPRTRRELKGKVINEDTILIPW